MEQTFTNGHPITEPITVGLSQSDIEATINAYLEFSELPEDIKAKAQYKPDPADDSRRNVGAGYRPSPKSAPNHLDTSKDKKEVFHYTPDITRVIGVLAAHDRPLALQRFDAAAQAVWETAATAARTKLQELAAEYPLVEGIHFNPDGATNNHLRFLAYYGNGEQELAAGHYDKSTLTIALAESHGGLRLAERPQDLSLLERDPTQPVIFHGRGWLKLMEQLGSTSNRVPAWHDVVEVDGLGVKDDILRWALIYFVNPARMDTAPSKIETETPLSDAEIAKLKQNYRQVGSLAVAL